MKTDVVLKNNLIQLEGERIESRASRESVVTARLNTKEVKLELGSNIASPKVTLDGGSGELSVTNGEYTVLEVGREGLKTTRAFANIVEARNGLKVLDLQGQKVAFQVYNRLPSRDSDANVTIDTAFSTITAGGDVGGSLQLLDADGRPRIDINAKTIFNSPVQIVIKDEQGKDILTLGGDGIVTCRDVELSGDEEVQSLKAAVKELRDEIAALKRRLPINIGGRIPVRDPLER